MAQRHCEGKGGCDDHEAHGLVEDDSPTRRKPKADEERQAKFRSAKPNKSARVPMTAPPLSTANALNFWGGFGSTYSSS